MKKLLIGLLLLPFLSFVAADWVTVKLDERVSVSFPSTPLTKEIGENNAWIQDIGKDARCMAMFMDFTNFGMDSAGVAAEMEKPESLANFRVGVLQEIANSKLVSEKTIKVKGYTCFEYVIDMGKTDPEALNMMYNRNIFIGSKMYTMNFFEKNNSSHEADRTKFFTSFKVNN